MNPLRTMRRLLRSTSGLAMTEFAMGAPFLLMAGLWGTETANFALVNMKVGQLAVHVADNASRIGDTSTLQDRRIYESDILDTFIGAQIQGGPGMALYDHGRVIVSSLEVNAGGDQYIHWQRCRGALPVASSFGNAGAILPNGMGPTGNEVLAQEGEAVIFVQINYTYRPLISSAFVGAPDISSLATFTVRDDRDLSQIYQRDPAAPDPVQSCGTFSGQINLGNDGSVVP